MKQPTLSPYENLTFREATEILYWTFATTSKAIFLSLLEDLMISADEPCNSIAPKWYDEYRLQLTENKKSK
jgi:hypothetical protein